MMLILQHKSLCFHWRDASNSSLYTVQCRPLILSRVSQGNEQEALLVAGSLKHMSAVTLRRNFRSKSFLRSAPETASERFRKTRGQLVTETVGEGGERQEKLKQRLRASHN
jgi:hypothetical protein